MPQSKPNRQAQVYIRGDNERRDFGSVRWVTEIARPPADWSPDDPEGADPDRMRYWRSYHTTKEAAIAQAERDGAEDFYGCPTVRQEIVQWCVKEDRVAEWAPIGDVIYIDPVEATLMSRISNVIPPSVTNTKYADWWLEWRKKTQYCPRCSGGVENCRECYGYSKKTEKRKC